jgi:plastocyanin
MIMKRSNGITPFLLPAVFLVMACNGDGDAARGGQDAADHVQVDAGTAGQVVGTVSFDGQAPDPRPIDMRGEAACAEKHDGQPVDRPVVVGDDRGLKNVYVYVTEGVPAGTWPTPDDEVELDQDGCIYHPQVLGLQTGQTLRIRNSDGLLHNVNARPQNQRGFNISQPTNMTTTRSFAQAEVMIPVRCDVHGWMSAYIGVQDHPYFAVTAEDGQFRIENLPPGDYVIEAWHEQYGTQTQNVTVAESGEARADFQYSAAMAGAVVPMGDAIDPHGHHPVSGHGGTH